MIFLRAGWSRVVVAGMLTAFSIIPALADEGAKTPEEFAAKYMAAFNAGDTAALKKMRYTTDADSPDFNSFRDAMLQADISSGQKYSKYTVLPAPGKQESKGPDGKPYEPNIKITNMVKLSAVSDSGTSSEEFPIGEKDGVYYQAGVKPAAKATTHDAAK